MTIIQVAITGCNSYFWIFVDKFEVFGYGRVEIHQLARIFP